MSPFRLALAALHRPGRNVTSRRARRRTSSQFRLAAERFEPRAMLAATIFTVETSVPAGPAVFGVGDTIPFAVLYDDAVTVTGNPVAYVNMTRADGTHGVAIYQGIDADGTTLSFLYTVQEGDTMDDSSFDVLLGVDNPSPGFPGFLVGGSITTDADGSAADREVDNDPAVDPTLDTTHPGLTIDGISPTITGITAPVAPVPSGYTAGQAVVITVTFAEPVKTSTTAPTLTLDNGATATLTSPAAVLSTTLQFAYVVRPGDVVDPLVNPLKVTAFNLNGATLTDAAGNHPAEPIIGPAVPLTLVKVNAAIAATSPQLSNDKNLPTIYSVVPGLIRLVFNTPVSNFTLSALRLYWNPPTLAGTPSRLISLRGATLRRVDASGTTWTLALPRAAVSAKGSYMLAIGGSLSNPSSTIYPAAAMTTPSKLYFKRV